MRWTKELTELRNVFMTLYPSGKDATRIVEQADLSSAYVDFTGSAIEIWHNVLEWANSQEAVGQILQQAQNEYPRNKALQNAVASWQAAEVPVPAIEPDRQLYKPDSIQAQALTNQNGGPVSLEKARWNPIKNMPNANIVVLFLPSDPENTNHLRLLREMGKIGQQLERAKFRDQFNLETEPLVTPEEVGQKLRDLSPHIVHFAGHGSSDGKLHWLDEAGQSMVVPIAAFSSMIGARRESNVQCVVLNACFTQTEARTLLEHVPYVIATLDAIDDGAAIAFATGLYQGLAGGDDLGEAFNAGLAQVQAQFAGEHKKFVLLER